MTSTSRTSKPNGKRSSTMPPLKRGLIWRSGGLKTDYLDRVRVMVNGIERPLQELLEYEPELADELHQKCRVHTYGSFYIAELAA